MIGDIPESYFEALASFIRSEGLSTRTLRLIVPAARLYSVTCDELIVAAETYLPSTEELDHDTNGTA